MAELQQGVVLGAGGDVAAAAGERGSFVAEGQRVVGGGPADAAAAAGSHAAGKGVAEAAEACSSSCGGVLRVGSGRQDSQTPAGWPPTSMQAAAAGEAAAGGLAVPGAAAPAAGPACAAAAEDEKKKKEGSMVGEEKEGGSSPNEPCPSLMLVDWYQLAMLYANWRQQKHNQRAVFEAFFRKAPFCGEFAVMAGVKQMVDFLLSMTFTDDHLKFFRRRFPNAPEEFFHYLGNISAADLTVHAIPEGTVVFPKVPLIRVEGPLAVCQLIETPILNILNYAVLVATNAARHRLAAGPHKQLLEFGARRAQGPNGALSASRYAYLGGFDATSNTEASFLFDIPLRGTMAHSFVTSFTSLEQLQCMLLPAEASPPLAPGAACPAVPVDIGTDYPTAAAERPAADFVDCVREFRKRVVALWADSNLETVMQEGELAAFTAFAQTFPHAFLALVDTYDTLVSGIPNAIVVAMALLSFGYRPVGVRLDSGDLSYLSQEARRMFREAAEAFNMPQLARLTIVASNELNEVVIAALNDQGHEVDAFAVGTNLVTCQAQPALGMVYKLVELDGQPCMKLSQDYEKTSLPSKKEVFRFYTRSGVPALDLLQEAAAAAPVAGEKIFCRHLFDDRKRCFFVPSRVERLLLPYVDRGKKVTEPRSLKEARAACMGALQQLRPDMTRQVNPTPFKVSASETYYRFFHRLWQSTAPVRTIE